MKAPHHPNEQPTPPAVGTLHHKDGRPAAKYCTRCNRLAKITLDDAEAIACCYRECKCGAPAKRFSLQCPTCRESEWKAKVRAQDAAELERTKTLPRIGPDYDGWVTRGSVYWSSWDEVPWEDYDFVYPTTKFALRIQADDIIESAVEQHHEDAEDHIGTDERQVLQTFLDTWCENTGVVSYEQDDSRVMWREDVEGS